MQLNQARRKLANFQVEIRRTSKQSLFKQMRGQIGATQIQLTNEAFSRFVRNRQKQVPAICLYNFKKIELTLLKQLLIPMLNKEVTYQSGNEENWFIDCRSAANLQFMSKLSSLNCPGVLLDFFRTTVAISRSVAQPFANLAHSKETRKCLFNIVANQNSGGLQIKRLYEEQKQQNSQNVVALLAFWASYIQDTPDEIQIQDFVQIMTAFKIQAEFKQIFFKRQTFAFIKVILQHISASKILDDSSRENALRNTISEQCRSLILFVKLKMPFIIKKAFDYRLAYHEIAQVLIATFQIPQMPDLFYECLFECEYLHRFILLLLKNEQNPSQTILNLKIALRLINCTATFNMFELLYLEGAVSITKELAHRTLFNGKVQQICAIILWNIIENDKDKYLIKIFEMVDYGQLLSQVEVGNEKDLYELVIKILESYPTNEVIAKNIFEAAEFISVLKMHKQQKDSQYLLSLAAVISKDLDYFFEHFPKIVRQIFDIYQQACFQGKENVLKKFQERFDLASQEATL